MTIWPCRRPAFFDGAWNRTHALPEDFMRCESRHAPSAVLDSVRSSSCHASMEPGTCALPVMKQPDSVHGLDPMSMNVLSATCHWSSDVWHTCMEQNDEVAATTTTIRVSQWAMHSRQGSIHLEACTMCNGDLQELRMWMHDSAFCVSALCYTCTNMGAGCWTACCNACCGIAPSARTAGRSTGIEAIWCMAASR